MATLLELTERAHGAYESAELGGNYDREWPRWYATHAVEHGIGSLVGREIDVEGLAALLESAYAEFAAIEPAPAESWSAYLARRIMAGT